MNDDFNKEVLNKLDTLTNLVENLAISTAKGFSGVDGRFKDMDVKINEVKEELKSDINGVNRRIDDLALNRVNYDIHNKLASRVDLIEEKISI